MVKNNKKLSKKENQAWILGFCKGAITLILILLTGKFFSKIGIEYPNLTIQQTNIVYIVSGILGAIFLSFAIWGFIKFCKKARRWFK
ncbi:hypothetical protein HOD29_02200 [archaeon]|jgi:hypothetical protein|nr:hypothetical protein [archaeon]